MCTHRQSYILPLTWETKFYTHTKQQNYVVMYILIFTVLDIKRKGKKIQNRMAENILQI